jgi:ribosomal protein S18 acetylase RimI-like enzyme
MIEVRPIITDEIDLFASIPDGSPNEALKSYILHQWEIGESKSEWCFIASIDDRQIGRVAYWTFASEPLDLKLGPWYLEWTDDFVQIGKKLFAESARLLEEQSIRSIEARIFSIRTPQFDEREFVLKHSGFTLEQEKIRFLFDEPGLLSSIPQSLAFEPISSLNEAQFLATIKDAMTASLDRADRIVIDEAGADKAALDRVQMLAEIDSDLTHWYLGYHNEEVVGFVIGQRLGEERAVINYIGTVASVRGKGYGKMLLKHATESLLRSGYKSIIADTDTLNKPMLDTLEACGYIPQEMIKSYILKLESA